MKQFSLGHCIIDKFNNGQAFPDFWWVGGNQSWFKGLLNVVQNLFF